MDTTTFILVAILYYIVTVGILILVLNLISRHDKKKYSNEINEMEKIRLKYFTCATLPSYPYFHMRIAKDSTYEASLEYWSKLQELMVMDASLLRYDEFRSFLVEAARIRGGSLIIALAIATLCC